MGLVSICPARRFLDDMGIEDVRIAARVLVSAFFHAMQTKSVYLKSGISPRIKALAEAASGIPVLSFGDEGETRIGGPKWSVVPVEVAVEQCSVRMTQLQELPAASGGISFGLDREPNSPRTGWSLWLHRGPLPLLEIELSDLSGFKPAPGWMGSLLASGAAHVLSDGRRFIGEADDLYLLLKRQKLFPYSGGPSTGTALSAGRQLRRMCRNVWLKESERATGPHKLSSWRWSQKRFVRMFDRMLLRCLEREELSRVLDNMGTDVATWLRAHT